MPIITREKQAPVTHTPGGKSTNLAPGGGATNLAPESKLTNLVHGGGATNLAPGGGAISLTPGGKSTNLASGGGATNLAPESKLTNLVHGGESTNLAPRGGATNLTSRGELAAEFRGELNPVHGSESTAVNGDENLELLNNIKLRIADRINLNRDTNDDEVLDLIESIVAESAYDQYTSITQRKLLIDKVFNSIRRLDVIQPLIDDNTITEIMVNGYSDIFIERNGKVSKTDLKFESNLKLEDVIQSIVSKVNRSVNEASPIVDARLTDGSRVNIVLRPIALEGPVMTIRKFPEKPMTLERLIRYGSMSGDIAELLTALVRAKYNIMISGGTGSGKTSLLNAVSGLIPKDERVITIEDSAELQLKLLSNLIRLETRNANTEGKGLVDMGSLIKTSLRMRPDRIVVGEIRDGHAAYYMLQSMNTGHDGSLTTGHANSATDMLSRLETMILGEEALPLEVIRKQISSAIDIIIHLARMKDGSRKIVEIDELEGVRDGQIVLNNLFYYSISGEAPGRFVYSGNMIKRPAKFERAGVMIPFT
ncbi:MAG: CpaF family protein [Oscillospiraceae bacterium]|nr:CpaF family protein [Oscillospiraceae bacterium]